MASKKELSDKLASYEHELNDLREYSAALAVERDGLEASNRAHSRRESERQRREHLEEQSRLREQERVAREEHLADLERGVLHLERASEHSISKDEAGVLRLDVTFTIDPQEHRHLEEALRPKPKAKTMIDVSNVIQRIIDQRNLCFHGIAPQVFLTGFDGAAAPSHA